MILYLTIIGVCSLVIFIVNYLTVYHDFSTTWFELALAVIIAVVVEIIIDLIFAFVVRWVLPSKWFDVSRKKYCATQFEKRLYEKLKIKSWKDKVLELGSLTSFSKRSIASPTDNEYISRFITEANYGIIVHLACIVFGFAVIFIYPLRIWYRIGLPVAIVNMVLNLLPLMILRYNLPKLHALYKFNNKRKSR